MTRRGTLTRGRTKGRVGSDKKAKEDEKNIVWCGYVAVEGLHRRLHLFFLESTFIDQNNPKRQTAGPRRGSPKLDLSGLV